MWFDIPLQQLILRFLALLVIASVHGAAVAGTAILLGDHGPKYDRRLTLNPFVHVDMLGSAVFIFFALGWIRPVAVDQREFRLAGAGRAVIVLAGFSALILAAALLRLLLVPLLTTLPYTAAVTTAAFARLAAEFCIWFGLLNLLPIPPLTGGQLVFAFIQKIPRQVEWALAAALVVAIATGFARRTLEPVYGALADLIIGR